MKNDENNDKQQKLTKLKVIKNTNAKLLSLEEKDKSFANRLKAIIGNQSARSFAAEIGVSSSLVHAYLIGKSDPTRAVLSTILHKRNINPEWLLTGNGPMMKEEASLPVPSQETSLINKPYTITNLEGNEITFTPSPNLINIPVLTMEAACGTGTFSDDSHITAMFSATREWLVRHLNRNPDHLCLIQAKGDSMTDTIKPNDMVFVDPEDAKSPTDGIWVFSIENQIFLKRLQFLPKQKLKVISDNPAYETYFLDLDETFRLLARYIATLSVKI